jgi:alpha-mannosidase II
MSLLFNAFKETLNNLKIQIENLESKSKESEKNLKDIDLLYEQFKANKDNLLNKLRAPQPVVDIPADLKLPILTVKKYDNATTTSNDQCIWLDKDPMQCTTQMYDVYNQHGFDDVDGGVWKQGWDINYDTAKWNRNNMLNIVITPHSHNDPG